MLQPLEVIILNLVIAFIDLKVVTELQQAELKEYVMITELSDQHEYLDCCVGILISLRQLV